MNGKTITAHARLFSSLVLLNMLVAMDGSVIAATNYRQMANQQDALPKPRKTVYVEKASQLREALKDARPGTHIVMRDVDWTNLGTVQIKCAGTEANPIVLTAKTPGKVSVRGDSNFEIRGSHFILHGLTFIEGGETTAVKFEKSSEYCRLTGCAIINWNPPETREMDWVSLNGKYNRIDHCYFAEHTTPGQTICVWGHWPNYHRIDHNYFYKQPKLHNGCESIKIGSGASFDNESEIVVEYNLFEDCDGDAEVVSVKRSNSTLRYNTVTQCAGHLTLRLAHRCRVEGNFIYNSKGGIRVIGEDHVVVNNYIQNSGWGFLLYGGQNVEWDPNSPEFKKSVHYRHAKNNLFAHNTIVGGQNGFLIGSSKDSLSPTGTKFYYNIVTGMENAFAILTPPTHTEYSRNIIHPKQNSMYDIKQKKDIGPVEGVVVADPLLAENNYGFMQLTRSSPGINRGKLSVLKLEADIKGDRRKTGQYDIGCEEYTPGSTLKPLTAKDVGPTWMQ